MFNISKLWRWALILLFCCKGQPKNDTKTLKIPLNSEPSSLDPQLADTGISVSILKQLTSTLFDYDSQQRILPFDAETYEWRSAGKELFVQIRQDLRWSDGQPLLACQYRDGILRALDPQLLSHLSEILFDIEGAEGRKLGQLPESAVKISCNDGQRSLNFETKLPYSPKLLHSLAFVVSAPIRKEVVALKGSYWLLPNGPQPGLSSGAFQIAEWSHDRRIRLVARQLREKSLPPNRQSGVDFVEMPLVRDPTTALAMYNANELDALDEIPPVLLPKLSDRADFYRSPFFTTYMVGYSLLANPVLKDRRVRQALSFSAGQEEYPKLLGGGEELSLGWIPPGLIPKSYRARPSLFNPTQAKQLLDEAGFRDRKKFPKLKLFYNSGERHQILMERLTHNWKDILGIEVELNPIEWKVLVSQVQTRAPDLWRYAWAAVYPDPVFFLELYLSTGLNNFGKWENKDFDRLVQGLRRVRLEDRDAAFWKKLQEAQDILVRDDPALIPIYHYVRNVLIKSNVKGLDYSGGLARYNLVHKL